MKRWLLPIIWSVSVFLFAMLVTGEFNRHKVEASTQRDRFVVECSGNSGDSVRVCEVFDRKIKLDYIVIVSDKGGILLVNQQNGDE